MKLALVAQSPFVLDALEQWAIQEGLHVLEKSGLLVHLEADLKAVEHAFQVRLDALEHGGWHTADQPTLPHGAVAVSGLSTQGRVYPHSQILDGPLPILATNGPRPGVTPSEVNAAYQVSGPYDGTGQTLAIAAWGVSFQQADIDAFCTQLGLPPCTPDVVSVDGYQNTFNPNDGPETTLDICWAHALAPGATVRVYMAPGGASDSAWALQVTTLLNTVLTDRVTPAVLNISYGDGEDQFPASDLQAWEHLIGQLVAKGTTVCVSSGDQGAYGLHVPEGPQIPRVDAPASCPSALAVGGTALWVNNLTVEDEWGWSNDVNAGASGGGYSAVFPRPAYQDRLTPPPAQRGVPDVAALASVDTPAFLIYDGNYWTIGGTSLASPIVAGMITRVAHQAGHPLGDVHAALYQHGGAICRDITVGNNNCFAVTGYACRPGWDEVTGWGSPIYPQWQAVWGKGGTQPVTSPTVNPATLTVAQLASAPDGQYGAANVPLQAAAKVVQDGLAAMHAATFFSLTHQPTGVYNEDAVQQAAARLWAAGVRA